ncbi:MAG: thiamine diphosphokinase [Fidelibacterota bacterium]|nr:MAG: thiamine diphosphokinase [Candidatus Neomarinimicrobiota bacterium]
MPLKPPVVILADGAFPTHSYPLKILYSAGTLICCDGAANRMLGSEREPDVVVGDLDSITPEARSAFQNQLVELSSQQSNDLEKALKWAAEEGASQVTILGAVGLREDHSLGNLLMLWTDFGAEITLLTDSGQFIPVHTYHDFHSFEGQEVSLYPDSAHVRITTSGLAFALRDSALSSAHKGTSNRSLGGTFSVEVAGGTVLVYQGYPSED